MALTNTWRWDEDSFIAAWEAGIFRDQRVELVEGEVWPVSIGPWHGAVMMNVARALPNGEWQVTGASLPSAGSIPDPDVWVYRAGSQPVARLGKTGRLARWDPADVALVVEVGDTSLPVDRDIKARLYGVTGYPTYWVVHREGVEVMTEPSAEGYRLRRLYGPGEDVPVPYRPEVTIAVDEILDVPD